MRARGVASVRRALLVGGGRANAMAILRAVRLARVFMGLVSGTFDVVQ